MITGIAEIAYELTAVEELLHYGCLGVNKQEHVVGETEDLLSFGFIQAHTAGVRCVQQINHSAGEHTKRNLFLSHSFISGEF